MKIFKIKVEDDYTANEKLMSSIFGRDLNDYIEIHYPTMTLRKSTPNMDVYRYTYNSVDELNKFINDNDLQEYLKDVYPNGVRYYNRRTTSGQPVVDIECYPVDNMSDRTIKDIPGATGAMEPAKVIPVSKYKNESEINVASTINKNPNTDNVALTINKKPNTDNVTSTINKKPNTYEGYKNYLTELSKRIFTITGTSRYEPASKRSSGFGEPITITFNDGADAPHDDFDYRNTFEHHVKVIMNKISFEYDKMIQLASDMTENELNRLSNNLKFTFNKGVDNDATKLNINIMSKINLPLTKAHIIIIKDAIRSDIKDLFTPLGIKTFNLEIHASDDATKLKYKLNQSQYISVPLKLNKTEVIDRLILLIEKKFAEMIHNDVPDSTKSNFHYVKPYGKAYYHSGVISDCFNVNITDKTNDNNQVKLFATIEFDQNILCRAFGLDITNINIRSMSHKLIQYRSVLQKDADILDFLSKHFPDQTTISYNLRPAINKNPA